MQFLCEPSDSLQGEVRVPGDKSISHRAVMFAAIAEGTSHIEGFLEGEDCLATLRAFKAMGAEVLHEAGTGRVRVTGVGKLGLRAPEAPLDVGNSGTSMRLMSGILAAQAFSSTLTGDASLQRRPMRRVVDPLRTMGAHIDTTDAGTAPLRIHAVADGLRGISYTSPIASAQVKSALLLAGLYAQGTTEVREPEASRDHTERMLSAFGVEIEAEPGRAMLRGEQQLRATDVAVPADISSAAFFMVGAAITPDADILLRDVGINPTRVGIVEILRRMGADIEMSTPRLVGGEPVADIRVKGGRLQGIHIDRELVAPAIDEFPAIFVAAACARGETVVSGAEELRVKESDRIQTMAQGLRALGISVVTMPDGARILGGRLSGGTIDAHGDHRIAMSFAMASLRAEQPILIRDCANVNTSFPGFAQLAGAAGLRIRERAQ
jgi:3-phosphoshikimate 1-carboxyvinyltransferase